jgi:hypothetical protein
MSIEAMKQALEALYELVTLFDRTRESGCLPMQLVRANATQKILRAAIAEASMQRLTDVQQEMDCYGDGNVYRGQRSSDSKTQTIYEGSFPEKIWEVVPPRREWVGLTKDEAWEISQHNADDYEYYRAIEAKLKEKNS